MTRFINFTLLSLASAVAATPLSRDANDGVRLAVNPKCGATDLVAGLPSLDTFKNIVTFGDSFTDAGVHNGSAPAPAVLVPPNPKAGGRMTNGPVWAEYLASDIGATLFPYAVSNSVTSKQLFPSFNGSDFQGQTQTFFSQRRGLDPSSTLYTVFFGIQDDELNNSTSYAQGAVAGIAYDIETLASPPTNAKNFLIVTATGLGSMSPGAAEFQSNLFNTAKNMNAELGYNVAVADLNNIWMAVLGGEYGEFGYVSDGACTVNAQTTAGACSDPAHTFYWIPGNPSTQTHRIMADYVEEVVSQC
ncbi:hypothetical protein PUNSTDRAFT_41511 [Punctularia strigosozonata HHB-11173 SS5]|uniref:uncharacterized protein n=1 Tax=Punctularia strigosozonata (strain HHB-11173) TaxID=741275 RepID=UPI00044166F4|nr:uncharacterized protein PUNSTDRAFT_41511 [Punctularia strigosozonata HHB-11173 SS5]EIN14243.1 hypothetical protein PUNSTDRAFT_41511 [Punctularia strigosozonata HHB-11173 SS5]